MLTTQRICRRGLAGNGDPRGLGRPIRQWTSRGGQTRRRTIWTRSWRRYLLMHK